MKNFLFTLLLCFHWTLEKPYKVIFQLYPECHLMVLLSQMKKNPTVGHIEDFNLRYK